MKQTQAYDYCLDFMSALVNNERTRACMLADFDDTILAANYKARAIKGFRADSRAQEFADRSGLNWRVRHAGDWLVYAAVI